MKRKSLRMVKVVVDQKSTVEFDVKVPDRHELNVYGQRKISMSRIS